jgi:hypothetical protein
MHVLCADDDGRVRQFWAEGEVFASGELEVDADTYVLTYVIASYSEYMIVCMMYHHSCRFYTHRGPS